MKTAPFWGLAVKRGWLELGAQLSFMAGFILLFLAGPTRAADFGHDVIYQIVTDRFVDGDPNNNDPEVSKGMYDPGRTNWQAYWGGDFAGIKSRLQYLSDLGVGAIWISPPLDNVDLVIKDASGLPTAPYHGYHAHDFMRIEEHFGDATKSFKAFDELVQAAHEKGIKIIVDFAPNHTNQLDKGEFGALFNDGKFVGAWKGDSAKLFHHSGEVKDWNDRYQIQYDRIFNLADLNQVNPFVDKYLKDAAIKLADHGVDGFRLDAVKHVVWGWLYSFANELATKHDTFIFGEWFDPDLNSPLFSDQCRFSNESGISLLDYPLSTAMRTVFSGNDKSGFVQLDQALAREDSAFQHPQNLVTFFDNHDITRFGNLTNDKDKLHLALAFLLTARGVPCILYGSEQYLINGTDGGKDPYDRPMMKEFGEDTKAFKLVSKLSSLRKVNDAIAYGSMKTLFKSDDAFVFERRFAGKLVVVAINKSVNGPVDVRDLSCSLPPGRHPDYLEGLMDGCSIQVDAGKEAGGAGTADLKLKAQSVSVWKSDIDYKVPAIGNILPPVAQEGVAVKISGTAFGFERGTVFFGGKQARILKWSDKEITALVPEGVLGSTDAAVVSTSNQRSRNYRFHALRSALLPVTFQLWDMPVVEDGDQFFIEGDGPEFGEWKEDPRSAQGPLLMAQPDFRFLTISLPKGAELSFKFFKMAKDGGITREAGGNHTIKIPAEGTPVEKVSWQK